MRFIQAFKTNLPTPLFGKPHVFNHYIPVSPSVCPNTTH